MPAPELGVVERSKVGRIRVALEPVQNNLYSIYLLTKADDLPGVHEWVTRTLASLSAEQRARFDLAVIGFYFTLMPEQRWSSFPDYLDHLERMDPLRMRQKMFDVYASMPLLGSPEHEAGKPHPDPSSVDWEAVLSSPESYLDFLRGRFKAEHISAELETEAYRYALDPPAMQALVVSTLREVWQDHLASEWARVRPMLEDSVKAFQQVDFSEMEIVEAARFITGQELAEEKWCQRLEAAQQVLFVPSAHAGPYLGRFHYEGIEGVFFGARLPEGSRVHAPDLSRAEILVRLNALNDDNRLRILRLISENGEQSSQEIIAALELSQSAASRHLKQLSATGYLIERRCNGAKCYALNPRRVQNTLEAVSNFILNR